VAAAHDLRASRVRPSGRFRESLISFGKVPKRHELLAHHDHVAEDKPEAPEALEMAGGRLRDFGVMSWTDASGAVYYAAGAGSWPKWLPEGASQFRVELDPSPAPPRVRIRALIHHGSGHRRERRDIEAALAAVHPDETGAWDIRRIAGGPNRPVKIDDQGR
jgi:hypothetical protein